MGTLPLIISGSSHIIGATEDCVSALVKGHEAEHIRLIDCKLGYFDYENNYANDDFLSLAEKMIETDSIVFVTPVYWYAMSAPMKVFFDRMSDLITYKKEMGRALKGKSVWMVANGTGETLPEGFEVPFRDTAKYFDMPYKGHHYHYTGTKNETLAKNSETALQIFKQEIFQS